jgi:predicted nicotinamide N-methyase
VSTSARAFVLHHTRLQELPGLDGLRLHLADDALTLWGATQAETGDPDAPLPYWGFAWGGGLAVASYLRDHPAVVEGRRVLDIASGSGLCAIAAKRSGAAAVTAVDIDPYAVAAITLNARANREKIDVVRDDLLDDPPPETDVILAGDCWYEESFAARITEWLQRANDSGIDVLIGDPGRRYLAHDTLNELASYNVRSTTDLEDLSRTRAWVYKLR